MTCFTPALNRGLAAISIRRKKPSVDDIRLQRLNVPSQPQIAERIEFPSLSDDRDFDASLSQLGFERPGMGQYGYMHIKLVTRQAESPAA